MRIVSVCLRYFRTKTPFSPDRSYDSYMI